MKGDSMDPPLSGVGSDKLWDTTDASKLWDAVDTDELTRDEIGMLARCLVSIYGTETWFKFPAEKFFREAKFEKAKDPEVSLKEWWDLWVKDAAPVDLYTYICREMLKQHRQEQVNFQGSTNQSKNQQQGLVIVDQVDATVSLPSEDTCARIRKYINDYFNKNTPWAELAKTHKSSG